MFKDRLLRSSNEGNLAKINSIVTFTIYPIPVIRPHYVTQLYFKLRLLYPPPLKEVARLRNALYPRHQVGCGFVDAFLDGFPGFCYSVMKCLNLSSDLHIDVFLQTVHGVGHVLLDFVLRGRELCVDRRP